MSYIENLTGSTIEAGLQETLSLGVGNYKIRGFDLAFSGDNIVLNSGVALIDGLRIVSTGDLNILKSISLNKYVFLRINTYTQVIDGVTTRKANLSLVAQSSETPINNDDLYETTTSTKDVLLAKITSGGIVDQNIANTLTEYDTGWINLVPAAGFTTTDAQYRRIGQTIYFKGKINKTTGNIIVNDLVFTLPYVIRAGTKNIITSGDTNSYFNVSIYENFSINGVSVTASKFIYLDNISYTLV